MARFGFAFFGSGVRFGSPDASTASHMRNLSRFLDNPFDDLRISLARLIAFATDNIQRMIANNGGGDFSARITASTSALSVVTNCFTDDQTKLGIRKARKDAKDDMRVSIRETVAKLIGAVTAEFGPDSATVVECVPQGRSIFSTCPDDQISQHLQVLINGITVQQALLGAPLVTKATALKTAWDTVYAASEAASGAKTATEEEKQAAREALQSALYLNLVKLMELFPRQPEKMALYMTQALLQAPGSGEEEEEEPEPPPPGP